jgi:hypothetical protein
MNKLDTAITSFREWADHENLTKHGRQQSIALAEALEEIRDLLTADKQPNTEEQPAPFAPWDCVKAKPGTKLYEEWGDTELMLGFGPDSEDEYRVFNPEVEYGCHQYVGVNEIVFVRRLKPRDQAEPPMVAFQGIDGVINTGRQPAPFQVGDWVRDDEDGFEGPIELIFDQGKRVRIKEDTSYYSRSVKYLRKINPPAPRFTFGQRVRIEWGEIDYLFLGYDHYGTHADVIGPDKNIHTIPIGLISAAPLDTSAD